MLKNPHKYTIKNQEILNSIEDGGRKWKVQFQKSEQTPPISLLKFTWFYIFKNQAPPTLEINHVSITKHQEKWMEIDYNDQEHKSLDIMSKNFPR